LSLFLHLDLPPAGFVIGFSSFGPTLNKEEHLVSLMCKLPRIEGEAYERDFEVPHL
jgi:hypothetical protein